MSNYNRQGQKRVGNMIPNNENRQKFNNMRNQHNQRPASIRIIGNKNNGQNRRPIKIVTARNSNQEATTDRAAMIAKNLEHMQQSALKKREAQERYYGQGKSPMTRNQPNRNLPKQRHNANRTSVQSRLGKHNLSSFNNTRQFVNSKRQFVNTNNKKIIMTQKQYVPQVKQEKILRIQNYNKKKVFPRKNNNQNQIKTVCPSTGQIKMLRPLRRNSNRNQQGNRPLNYTVCVENSKPRTDNLFNGMMYKHHVSSDLNPMLQQEIRRIQNKSLSLQITNLNNPVVTKVPIMTTGTTLHERFSMI